MAITYSLAPNPKWYLVNLTGLPLGGGYLATFRSLVKTQQKLVYEDGAGNFPWPYVVIPNVGSQGILIDENGTQGPFYFEFDSANADETYYLEVYDSNGNLQWTIDDFFPPSGGGGGEVTEVISIPQLITNNVCSNNIGATANPIASTFLTLAPGSHSGFALTAANAGPDICFIKSNTSATDQIKFLPFTLGANPLTGDASPTQYIQYNCTNTPAGETFKYFQFPITQNVQNLSNNTISLTLWAQGISGTQTIDVQLMQFFGDGAGATSPVTTVLQTLSLTNSWSQYQITAAVPSVSGVTIGGCHNDALFLQLEMPLDASCSINFYKPSLYLGNMAPTAQYITNDMNDGVLNSPRTSDVKISFDYDGSNYVPGGWIFMNDGTIGNPSSNATSRANFDTFPLFNKLWNQISNTYCQLVTSAGILANRGATSIADFTANNALFIPKGLGRVFAGSDPSGVSFSKVFTASSSTLTVNDTSSFYTGTPCTVANTGGALPMPLVTATTYYIIVLSGTTLQLATTLANAEAGTNITLTTAGTGTNSMTVTLPSYALGQYIGEFMHAPIIGEMATHNHPGSTVASTDHSPAFTPTLYTQGTDVQSGGPTVPLTIASQGGGNIFNITQPTIFANYLIKL